MKKLSQEEKAKAYDEAVRKASIAYKDEDRHLKATLERIFPELKESEDERIRNFLHHTFTAEYLSEDKLSKWHGEPVANILAWLEKQGEKPQGKSALEAINEEKVDNANKVESKFKVGDWIINKSHDICLITDIDLENGYYICESNRFGNTDGDIDLTDKAFHLWDIAKDAKSGDVLASKDKLNILIFKNLDTSTSFSSYYNIAGKGELGWSNECFIPATKEQRDTFFAKMKDSGYEFNFESKELKKIEQHHTWSEDDERTIKRIDSLLYAINESEFEDIHAWLESLKERCTWKPSDEQMEALSIAIHESLRGQSKFKDLFSLNQDLKKLKG